MAIYAAKLVEEGRRRKDLVKELKFLEVLQAERAGVQ